MNIEANNGKGCKTVLWIITDVSNGSGGQRTVFQNLMFLTSIGYRCDLLLDGTNDNAEGIRGKILRWYGINFGGRIFCNDEPKIEYDAVFATYYTTARRATNIKAKKKFYFVQDYEPWFFSMSEERIEAKASYKLGLKPITIGAWLAKELNNKFDIDTENFNFCADLDIYHRDKDVQREDAICFVYQPHKPWRCAKMGLKALQIIQLIKPDLKIYLYGSEKRVPFNIEAKHLGILTTDKCNELYNKCKVGICMSASNPSRIPFEMMAAGLPVVDLYLDNNLYDLPGDGSLLAEPSAEAIAAAVLRILDDEKLRKKMSCGGEKYMRNYPLEKGFMEFGKIIENGFGDKKEYDDYSKSYNKKAVKPLVGVVWPSSDVFFKTSEEIEHEKEIKRLEEKEKKQEDERKRFEAEEKERIRQEEEWRRNLTIPQKIYLKIRYIFLGK